MQADCNRQSGVTLVELLVAMTLSLILMGGVIQLFVANKQSYRISEELARMQEGARYAAFLLEKDIRMAGFTGCSGRDQLVTAVSNRIKADSGDLAGAVGGDLDHLTPERGIEGWEADDTATGEFTAQVDGAVSEARGNNNWDTVAGGGTSAPVLNANTDSVSNSDILRLWHIEGSPTLVDVSGVVLDAPDPPNSPPYEADDLVMVSDCTNVDLVYVCSVDAGNNQATLCGDNNNNDFPLRNDGREGLHAYKFSGWVYYVGKRADTASNPPSLYRYQISEQGLAETPEELVEGVESIQVLYGEDTSTDPDGIAERYVAATDVTDWDNVVSVRVGILMKSLDEDIVPISNPADPPTFNFNGLDVDYAEEPAGSGSAPLRYAFITTVTLRSRAL